MRRIVLASHHQMADGLKDTLQFLSAMENVSAISAYIDETLIEDQIDKLFNEFDEEDEIFILTDMVPLNVHRLVV